MRPFKIDIAEEQIKELQMRLRSARWPGSIFQQGSEDGVSLPFVQRLVSHWQTDFDWRAQEARLNSLPQFIANIDGYDIHFVHVKGKGANSMPLILTHGWPGSFIEFERMIPHLTDPAAHDGDPNDAFDVVVPSLPGFGFSSSPKQAGISSKQIAILWHKLMKQLGYDRFSAQGGDIGAGVSKWLAALFSEDLIGVHVNYISASFRPPLGDGFPPVTKEESDFLRRISDFAASEGAYSALQETKPQTLAFSLSDSPVGLAAWIAEKFLSWADHDGALEKTVSLDVLLTNISLYWFGNTIDASLRIYKENKLQPLAFDTAVSNVPIGVAHFPKEFPTPPRSWLERCFRVERYTEMPRGGHFAALEQPELLTEDVRAMFRPLRITT